MKKLVILFSLVFFAFVISASAQSSVSSEKQSTAAEQAPVTEKVKGDDDGISKGCGAFSSKSGKAKCCAKSKSMAKKTSTEASSNSNAEAVVSERKAVAEAGSK